MLQEKSPRADGTAERATIGNSSQANNSTPGNPPQVNFQLALLDGSSRAGAIMPWGKPGPILLPDDASARRELAAAHIAGGPARVVYCPQGKKPETIELPELALLGYCPAADKQCRFAAVDLDSASGHGDGGLVDPCRALGAIAERASNTGLLPGFVAARSKSGAGRHVWLIPPEPTPIDDAALVIAALTAQAYAVATQDVADSGGELPHAFATGTGAIAIPGRAGGVELYPRATEPPALGWGIILPCGGRFAAHGGGLIVDAFTDTPIELANVPRCPAPAWERFLREARAELDKRRRHNKPPQSPARPLAAPWRNANRAALHPATLQLLDGHIEQGQRNSALFAATCNMIGNGVEPAEVERQALEAARRIGLPDREARATIRSALRAKGVAA